MNSQEMKTAQSFILLACAAAVAGAEPVAEKAATPPAMAWIPGGTFLMGTNDKESFPNERPAHLVQVQGFWMDEHDVTNAEFSKFVEATGYVTTAERKIDWEDLKKEVPPGTPKPDDSALAPGSLVFTPTAGPVPLNDLSAWWRWVHGANWRHPEGPESSIQGRENHPVVQVSWHDAVAYAQWAANGYLPKPSGNSPPAAGWNQSGTSGVTNSSRMANTWRIPGKDYFRFETVAKMDLWVLRPWAPSLPMATAYTTWPATCGNGAATGIGSIATSRLLAKTFVATHVDRLRVMIQAIRTLPSASSKVVHFFATPTTARVIALARVAGRRPTPVRPIQVSDA